jgi:predicted ATPase/DNA-binding CsgD family transcriptional regulator
MAARIFTVLVVPATEHGPLLQLARSTTPTVDTDPQPTDDPQPIPAPTAIIAPPLHLPALLFAAELIGREAEQADLVQRLCAMPQRLITVVGPGGVGKTSLALVVAATLRTRTDAPFPDGIAIVPLATASNVADVPLVIARALGLPPQNARPVIDQLIGVLRDRKLLLILDNLEQLLITSAGDTLVMLIDQLLRAAPGLRILATSRERLQLQSEWVLTLGGLELPQFDPHVPIEATGAVRLFLERARQVAPDFTLRPEDSPFVARICRYVEGSPLAIELAASWTRALTLAEIASELDQALDFLTRSERDRPARHQSMRTVLDHSWQLLDTAERLTLARLAVFHDGCDREAAISITGTNLLTITALIDKSLLRRSERHGSTRYTLHELVRHYAAEQLAADPADCIATTARHSAYYADLIQRTITRQTGGSSPEGWVKLASNSENGRAAWMYAATSGDTSLVLAMARGLMIFYDVRGWVREAVALFAEAAAALRAGDPLAAAALGVALGHQGYFLIKAGQPHTAAPLLHEAAALLESAGARAEQAHVLIHLGTIEQYAVHFALAQSHYGQAARLAAESGDHFTQLWATFFQGAVALAIGSYSEAERHFGACLAAWRIQGYSRGITSSLNILAETLRLTGNPAALSYLDESMQIARTTQDTQAMASCLREMGAQALAHGEFVKARQLLTESCVLARELAAPRIYGRSRQLLVQTEIQLGDYLAARQGCRELVREVGPRVPLLLPAIAYEVACLLLAEGDDQAALAILIALKTTPGEYAALQFAASLRTSLEQRCTPKQRAAAQSHGSDLLAWLAELLAQPPRATEAAIPQPAPPPVVTGGLYIPATAETLSPREVDVLRLLMAGASNPLIASSLIISPFTVKNHVARILEKLGVATRTLAALRGRELGLTPTQ